MKLNTTDAKFTWDCFYGKESKLNLLGKIVSFPFIAIGCLVFLVGDTLLMKQEKEP